MTDPSHGKNTGAQHDGMHSASMYVTICMYVSIYHMYMHMYNVCVNEARVTEAHGSDAVQIPYNDNNPVDNLDSSDRQRMEGRGGGMGMDNRVSAICKAQRSLYIHDTQVIGTY